MHAIYINMHLHIAYTYCVGFIYIDIYFILLYLQTQQSKSDTSLSL